MQFEELREKYDKFIYEKYEINDTWDWWNITYFFNIPWLTEFRPTIQIDKKNIKNQTIDESFVNYLVFHIGLVELISYWKCCCPENVEIKAWYIEGIKVIHGNVILVFNLIVVSINMAYYVAFTLMSFMNLYCKRNKSILLFKFFSFHRYLHIGGFPDKKRVLYITRALEILKREGSITSLPLCLPILLSFGTSVPRLILVQRTSFDAA